jgi:hypothetical protein
MDKYIAKTGDRLDTVLFVYYGSLDFLNEFLETNYHLLLKDIVDGDIIYLPDFSIPIVEDENAGASLW